MSLRDVLRVLITPSCWLQVGTYSEDWDRTLVGLLQTDRFRNIGDYDATIGAYSVWIANHPYGSMRFGVFRPRRATILRAAQKLAADMIANAGRA